MKLHFEDNLDYQKAAVESVVGLFKGQEIAGSEFTVRRDPGADFSLGKTEWGAGLAVGNRLLLTDEQIADNLRKVQIRNGLQPAEKLASGDFTVEMETGTGKTYVYLRTLFELNRNYGFAKFVIVVPSVAIKEGVYKTLQITQEHFESLYPQAKGYEYFLYDSSKLGRVRNFATSANIQIMVTTVGAINKKNVNNMYKENENTGGERPIDLVRATKPIIIVDEPQSVDGGLTGKGREALEAMAPLCTLRYSATHVEEHHMTFRLDAVDAYERGLVKQIEVASLDVGGGHNTPYIRLESTQNRRGSITAKVEVDVERKGGPRREYCTVEDGDSLEQRTGRSMYENMRIGTINCGKNRQSIEINGGGCDRVLKPGEEIGGIDRDQVTRLMIRRTIKEHLDKELAFKARGKPIKVLSLFFIDSVENYRTYDEDGNPGKGKYAVMFEEEYRKLAASADYASLFEELDLAATVAAVHDGYFSIDKKGRAVDTAENTQAHRDNAERAYNLIMREKEALLSFDTQLKFIFSHSALKEGWDNPNVFQICSLRDMRSERERRQTLGRGLRLCVNQDGERLRDREVNTLTVIASESYEQFAGNLQKEIESDTGIRFGIVEAHQFSAISAVKDGREDVLGFGRSRQIWESLKEGGFIDDAGKVQDSLRAQLSVGGFVLPADINGELTEVYGADEAQAISSRVQSMLKKLAGRLNIKNANERRAVRTRRAILESEDFRALWERIKHKTTYRVNFDNQKLLDSCTAAIQKDLVVTQAHARFRKADLAIGKGGVEARETATSGRTAVEEAPFELPDIITELQDRTQLTRRSIVKILMDSKRLQDFLKNPQQFMDFCADAINRAKRMALVDGIKYTRIGPDHYYAQELFEQEELKGYLKNTLAATKSVHRQVVYDSAGVEKSFAEGLEKNEKVKVYAKLPSWFKVPTPLGSYNPDWAVVLEGQAGDRLFFVVETKGSTWVDDLRQVEGAKIACGKAHFEEIASGVAERPAQYIKAKDIDDLMDSTGNN